MKKFVVTFVILVALAFISVGIMPAMAEASPYSLNSERINRNLSLKYLPLNSLSAMTASDYSLYAADINGLYELPFADINATKTNNNADIKDLEMFGENLFALTNDGVYYYDDLIVAGEYIDFAVKEDSLYLLGQAEVCVYNLKTAEKTIISIAGELKSIAVAFDNVYILIGQDIYLVDGSTYYVVFPAEKNVRAIKGNADYLVCLGDRVQLYDNEFNLKKELVVLAADIALGSSSLFVAYQSEYNISRFDLVDFEEESFSAGASDADYFFDSPSSVFSRNGQILINDYYNNRLSVIDAAGINHIPVTRPVCSYITLSGKTIIANALSQLTIIDNDETVTIPLSLNEKNITIKKLAGDLFDNVFILAEQSGNPCILTTSNLETFDELDLSPTVNIKAIGNKVGGGIFAYDSMENKIISLSDESYYDIPSAIQLKDFAIDYDGKIYAIDTNGYLVIIYNNEILATSENNTYNAIAISPVTIPNTINYGDLLLLSEQTHSLNRITAESALVALPSQPAINPQNDTAPLSDGSVTIGIINHNIPLYSLPAESSIQMILQKDTYVTIRQEYSQGEMLFVIAENPSQNRIEYGYVISSAVSSCDFTTPPTSIVKVVLLIKEVYNYPSLYSTSIRQISAGDTISLISFADYYTDSSNQHWYRVRLDNNNEGFITTENLSTSFFKSNTVTLKTNAVIKEDTQLYIYDSLARRYIPFPQKEMIEAGTDVKVSTPFSSSKEYTKIEFYIDGQLIDLDVYVKTKYIDFQGIDVMKIAIICAIVATTILASAMVLWAMKKHKKNK